MKKYKLKFILNVFLFILILTVVCALQLIKNGKNSFILPITQAEIIFVFFSSLSLEVINLPFDDNFCYMEKSKKRKKRIGNLILLIMGGISSLISLIVYVLYGAMGLYSSCWIIILFFDFIFYIIINSRKFLIERDTILAKEHK